MARGRVRIPIIADPSGVKKGTAQAQRDLRSFDKNAGRTQGVITGLSSTASSLGLAFGAGGIALGVSHSITAFKDLEKQNARTIAQLKNLGVNTDAVRKKIDESTASLSKMSGFQEHELKASFGTLLTSTHDVTGALNLNVTAANLARLRQIDLGTASKVLGKVVDGNVGILNRYGIHIEKGTSVTEALRQVQLKAAGQAREFGSTTAGASDKASASITKLEEKVGGQLAPALNEAAGATLSFAGATGTLIEQVGGLGPVFSGAAGFGAFKLLAPQVGKASSALGERGLVGALVSTISPMSAAAIGAGLLAGGVYEIWHNSESAEQAVSGLNEKIRGLNAALDQTQIAKDAITSAKDYVKATKDSEAAARARATALHADIVQLKEHKGSEAQVEAATKKWKKALDDVVPAVHAKQRAQHELEAANRNLKTSIGGVTDAENAQAVKSRDVIQKAKDLIDVTRINSTEAGKFVTNVDKSALAAEAFARGMDNAASKTRAADVDVRTADTNLAAFARRMQRLPTVREIKLITRYSAEGLSLTEIQRRLDHLHNKQIAVSVRSTFGNAPNPITGISPSNERNLPAGSRGGQGSASGGFVSGRYADGDRIPALLAGEEAVLNPRQIGMVDSGMSVMGALAATGAPMIGAGGFIGGGAPRRKRKKRGPNDVFRPGAVLDRSQVFDDRFIPKPMRLITFEDGSHLWVLDPHPGGVESWAERWNDQHDTPIGFAGGKAPRAKDGSYANDYLQRKRGVWYYHYRQGEPVPIPRGKPDDIAAWMMEFAGRGISPARARMTGEWWVKHSREGRVFAASYATGGKPAARGGVSSTNVGHGGQAKNLAGAMAARIAAALDRKSAAWELSSAQSQLAISRANSYGDPTGNALALEADAVLESKIATSIGAVLAHPDKALGIKGAKLTGGQRTQLLQALASAIDQNKSDLDAAWALRHPETPDRGGEASAAEADPNGDLQARLDQQTEIARVATRGALLSEAELKAFTGSGDIGTGGFGSAFDAARGGPILALGDLRSLQAIAGGAAAGFGLQPSISANRVSVNI